MISIFLKLIHVIPWLKIEILGHSFCAKSVKVSPVGVYQLAIQPSFATTLTTKVGRWVKKLNVGIAGSDLVQFAT
jgi:hypothetical protein